MNSDEPRNGEATRPPTRGETWLARVMFTLAFVYLLLFAGLIHRAQEPQVTPAEIEFLTAGVAVLWPLFLIEAVAGIFRRDRSRPRRFVLLRAGVVIVLPPFRMGLTDPRTGLIWLPRLGWQPRGKDLYRRLDRAFGGPMLLFAFLILPVLGLEFFRAEEVRASPTLALALHIGVSIIWVAFALEFVLESSSAPNTMTHIRERWLDLAIVVLPMTEFVLTKWVDAAPVARLVQFSGAAPADKINRMQRLYRLRGMAGKSWNAFLLLGGLGRLIGDTRRKELRKIENQIALLEEQLAELREQGNKIRAELDAENDLKPNASRA